MKLINPRNQILNVEEIYELGVGRPLLPRYQEVLGHLQQLPKEVASVEDVILIVGENFRQRIAGPFMCDECCSLVDTLVQLGEEPDWESSTADICLSCLHKALALMESK